MRLFRMLMVAGVVLAAAGCAPVISSPGALNVSTGYGASQCSVLGGSPEAARMGIRSPLIDVRSIQALVQRIQARASLGFSAASSSVSWRSIAAGGC